MNSTIDRIVETLGLAVEATDSGSWERNERGVRIRRHTLRVTCKNRTLTREHTEFKGDGGLDGAFTLGELAAEAEDHLAEGQDMQWWLSEHSTGSEVRDQRAYRAAMSRSAELRDLVGGARNLARLAKAYRSLD